MSKNFECVRVVIRCRPLNETEKKDGRVCIVNMDTRTGQVIVRNPKIVDEVPKTFTFDQIFDTQSQ
jgi:kinesin family protein 3/17